MEDGSGSDRERKSSATAWIYSQFHKGGPAYRVKEAVYHRYYCNACLAHETAAVKTAREQYGQQGRGVTADVLRTIAMGRIEFFTPRQDLMLEHLRLYCQHVLPDTPKEANTIHRILSQLSSDVYTNPYDFGSIYEILAHPKTPKGKLDLLVPGSASPANIFKGHERSLLRRSSKRQKEKARNKQRIKRAKLESYRNDELDESATEGSEDRGESVTDVMDTKRHKEDDRASSEEEGDTTFEDENEENEEDEEEVEPPEVDYPSSDLLKALSAHAGAHYASRGLLSSNVQPVDTEGIRLPSMVQALDGSALIALAILTQELVRSTVITPRVPEPPEVHFARKVGKRGLGNATRSRELKEWTDAVLSALPAGETRGIRDLTALMGGDNSTDSPGHMA
ncbi:MAG: hypothetical protein CYPHOPRED_000097 [Cyphobasidiales sp. Tagirdzhanova-0007]|nr:MAG: hypothetical protein CYPHOPRED_000097 [Cyphobasidiales sp. Tagirdzhanova-0007]